MDRIFKSLKNFVSNPYYKGSLQKFYSFLLTEYLRVIVLDADGVPLRSLDHLFLLRLPYGVHLAAPQGYWLDDYGFVHKDNSGSLCPRTAYVQVTSAFLIVEPSQALYQRAETHFASLNVTNAHSKIKEMLDMDIIHKEFGCKDEILVLPKAYGTLDSDFR